MRFHFANPQDLIPKDSDNWYLGIISKYIFEELSKKIKGAPVDWDIVDVRGGRIMRK